MTSIKKLKPYINKINKNRQGLCFIEKKGVLSGICTDGDIRRSLLKGFNLRSQVSKILKKNFISFNYKTPTEVIQNKINIGSPITYAPYFNKIGKHSLVGTSIDDRAGCAIILEVAKNLKKNIYRPTVHIVFSVQEEFNLRGVLPAAQKLKPDIAIQIDLMLSSDTPDMEKQGDVFLGKGPCMSMYSFHGRGTLNGLIPHPSLTNLFKVEKYSSDKFELLIIKAIMAANSKINPLAASSLKNHLKGLDK